MSKHTLSAVLAFCILAGGTAAIGSEMFGHRHAATAQARMATVTLPEVTIVGHRESAIASVTLPKVTVTGHCEEATATVTLPAVTIVGHRQAPTRVAVETQASEPQRVQ